MGRDLFCERGDVMIGCESVDVEWPQSTVGEEQIMHRRFWEDDGVGSQPVEGHLVDGFNELLELR